MFKMNERTIKLIEKQLKKEGIAPCKNWSKKFLCLVAESANGDTYFTVFNRTLKEMYTTCTIYNEVDDFDSWLGETTAVNRMGKVTDFQNAVADWATSPSWKTCGMPPLR